MTVLIPPSSKSINSWFKSGTGSGQCAMLVVGGANEALLAKPGTPEIILKPKLGFIKLAIKAGVSLVPVFAFGENDVWDQDAQPDKNSLAGKFHRLFKSHTGIELPKFKGRGILNYSSGLLPFRRPIHVVFGEPIDTVKCEVPSEDYLREVHGKYIEGILKVYNEHKYKYIPMVDGKIPDLVIH